jgi:hypothetical protein
MKKMSRRLSMVLVVLALSFAFTSSPAWAREKQVRPTRSMYVPVEFKLCEHLHDAVLFEGDQALSLLPAKRIFQFTYYPELERIVPVRSDVRVEGTRDNGEKFVGKLAVTPWGIFTAKDRIELDMKKQLARMRYKLDVRYEPVVMRLRCSDSCGRDVETQTADAATGAP